MKRYLKLVNFEVNRFIKIYAVLIAITVISQLTGAFLMANRYLKLAEEVMGNSSMSVETFIEGYNMVSFFEFMRSSWFIAPIVLSITALIFYVFLIWYRDWFGKNTFVYRLLMIPTARLNIYFGKATAIFLMVLGLVSVQLILLPVENMFLKYLLPSEFYSSVTVTEIIRSSEILNVLSPLTFFDFSLNYSLGFIFVFVIFTAILFERSFGIRGILLGGLYGAICFGLFILPLIISTFYEKFLLYPMEYFNLQILLSLIILVSSIVISRFLLNKKITV